MTCEVWKQQAKSNILKNPAILTRMQCCRTASVAFRCFSRFYGITKILALKSWYQKTEMNSYSPACHDVLHSDDPSAAPGILKGSEAIRLWIIKPLWNLILISSSRSGKGSERTLSHILLFFKCWNKNYFLI